ncbi:ESX-1 secretion-associated protein EspK-like [Drosophila ficusphila]|uniref:ESX-1 secretion-associated protein EspK-like n=1 Tax=Drosophila ficusphila TaxID=30025 RepID=UPI001C8A6988|nr:ESX-1 secretion-associated protein EspK-like [Drosophila ficusphila]
MDGADPLPPVGSPSVEPETAPPLNPFEPLILRITGDVGPPAKPPTPPTDILRCGKLISSTVLALRCRTADTPPAPATPTEAAPATPPTPPTTPPTTNCCCCWPLLAGEPVATTAAATAPAPDPDINPDPDPTPDPTPEPAAPGPPGGVIPTALPLRPRCTSSTLSKLLLV